MEIIQATTAPNLSKKAAALTALLLTGLFGQANSVLADETALGFDSGERLVVPYHLKIQHRRGFEVYYLVSPETLERNHLLEALAGLLGVDPQTATKVTLGIPLPKIDAGVTDQHPFYAAPAGMVICKAGPIGHLEASHAAWSATVRRDPPYNGLALYTSVGTGQGDTHRIEGSFFIEFVKPTDGWEQKYGCMPNKTVVWDRNRTD